MIQGIDSVFVLHCKKGYEDRARSIESQFGKFGIAFKYILDFDLADLTPEVLDAQFVPNTLSRVSMSVCLKHFRAHRLAMERGSQRTLIFEDDVILGPTFVDDMRAVMREAEDIRDAHIIYLSDACNMYTPRSQRRPGQRVYPATASRAADSYLISAETCRRRVAWLEKNRVHDPIDHLFNRMDAEIGVKPYWVEDPIVSQGSMTGAFASAIDNQHTLFVQRVRWQLDKFYRKHILRNLR